MDDLKAFRKLGVKWKNATELQQEQIAVFHLFLQVIYLRIAASYRPGESFVYLRENIQHSSYSPVHAGFSAFH